MDKNIDENKVKWDNEIKEFCKDCPVKDDPTRHIYITGIACCDFCFRGE